MCSVVLKKLKRDKNDEKIAYLSLFYEHVVCDSRVRLRKIFCLAFHQRCTLTPRSQNIFYILLHFLIWSGKLGSGQIGQFLTGSITFHRPGRAKCEICFVIGESMGISGERRDKKIF